MTQQQETYYRKPGWITQKIANPLTVALTRLGISVWGSRILQVRGRSTGEVREVPVNRLDLDGGHYLVAARGQAQWVRNVRADGGRLALVVGKRRELWTAVEVADEDKLDILRAYLKKWKAEVGVFFGGVDATSPESELRRIAPRHPVFRLEQRSA